MLAKLFYEDGRILKKEVVITETHYALYTIFQIGKDNGILCDEYIPFFNLFITA